MKLHVGVHNQAVATLEATDGFQHVMTYHPAVQPEQFVSLLLPVRQYNSTMLVICTNIAAIDLTQEVLP